MTTGVVRTDDATQTRAAIAGFLAGYCGSTRCSYATDLRLLAAWWRRGERAPVRRSGAQLELFGRWMAWCSLDITAPAAACLARHVSAPTWPACTRPP
jgi:hypothetical protein